MQIRRTSICGAVETLLIEEKALNSHAKEIINALLNSGCEVRVDKVNKLFEGKLKKQLNRIGRQNILMQSFQSRRSKM